MKQGVKLSDSEILVLRYFMGKTDRTVTEIALKIGITFWELYNPLNNRTQCGIKPYKKITQFIKRLKKTGNI